MWIVLAFPLGVAALVGIIKACEWYVDQRDTAAAVTPEQKRDVVLNRLIRRYQWERHPDPVGAACDHMAHLESVERFRRHACETYLRTGQSLRDIQDDWLASQEKAALWVCQRIKTDRARTLRNNAVLADAIRNTPAEDIFMYEPAATKWREEQSKPKPAYTPKRDAVADYVAEAAFAAGNRL